MKRLVVAAACVVLGGCLVVVPGRAAPAAPDVVFVGPAVRVGAVASHQHLHHADCGHGRRWHGGRFVYAVSGRWEYVDGGHLYVYRTVRSQPAVVAKKKTPRRGHDGRHEKDHGRGNDREGIQRYAPTGEAR